MKNPSVLIVWPLLLASLFVYPSPATAQTEYWDPSNTGGTGSGGPGAWSTGTPWFNGTADVAWPAGGSAFFEGAAGGTVTLSTGVSVDGLTFTTTGYTLSGSTITLAGTPTITVPGSGTETINSILTGTVPWSLSGSGTLILGAVNTFSSNLTISAGSTLTINSAGQLHSGANSVFTNNMTNNGSFIYSSSAAQTIGGGGNGFGVLSGTGTVTENGPGTLTFAGNRNSYMGGTIINTGGTVSFGGDNTSGVGNLGEVPSSFMANNIVLGGGTLLANNAVALAANRGIQLTANSTVDVASGHTMTIYGIISQSGGSFGLTTTPSGGVLQLTNVNTYSGPTIVSAGTLVGNVAGSIPGNVTVSTSAGVLTLSNAAAMSANAVLSLPASNPAGQMNLDFTGTQNISTLIDGGNIQPVGTYGATGSGATIYAGPIFTGAGLLNVTGEAYWDPGNTGGTGSGGNGNWDASSTSDWFNGSSDTTWPSGTFANFDGPAGTVTLNASLSADGLAFTTAGYTISEGSGSPVLTLTGAPVITVPSGATSVNCTLAGTGGLTENGSGTLSLGGVDTYTGGTTVSAGSTLTIAGAGQLGSGTYAGNITNAGTFTYNSTAAQTLSGVISGAGLLNQSGAGTLTLSAVNTYTNLTTISSGSILTIGGAGTLPSANAVADNGSFVYSSSAGQTMSAVISGAGSVTQNGPGTLTFSGGNKTYTGGITINGGEVSIGGDGASAGSAANLGEVPASFVATNIVLNGGTLSANNNVALNANRGIQLTANSTLDVGTQQGAHQIMTVAGVISQSGGSFGITKTSAGILGLTNANTYTGTTIVSAGTLDGDVAGSIPASVTVNTGGTLTLSNAAAMSADAALTLPATPSAGQVNLNFTGTQVVSGLIVGSTAQAAGVYSSSSTLGGVSGVITGTGTLTVMGLGVTYWDPSNTGGTGSGGNGNWDASSTADWFNGSSDTTWPSGTFANFDGPAGTVMLNASVNADGLAFTTAGYTITEGSGSPVLTLTGAPVISVSSGTAAINCTLAGTGGLTESGAGTLSLGGVDTYTGATIVSGGGTLAIGGAGQLGSGAYAGNITNAGTFIYNSSAAQTLSGVISGVGLLNQSGAGTLTLSGVNTFSSNMSIGLGSTLTIGGAGQLASGTYTNNMTNNGFFVYSSSAAQTVGGAGNGFGVLSGTGTVIQNGPGTLTFAGNRNSYTGGTIINGGILSFGGDNVSGVGNLGEVPASFVATNIVLNGGTLSANNGVTLAAHRGIQLTANSTLDVAAGHTLAIEGIVSQSGGSFGIKKTSAGTLEIIGTNTYTGTTTISAGTLYIYTTGSNTGNITINTAGTLTLSNASGMSSGATLTLPASSTAGQVNLDFSGTQTIATLISNSVTQAAGTYGPIGSSATYQSATFAGTGTLTVTSGGGPTTSSTAVTLAGGSSNPSAYGVTESFTATVTGTSPSGSVQFYVNGSAQGGPVTLTPFNSTTSTATLPIASPPLIPVATSPYQIPVTASYSGDANNTTSTSPAYEQVVTNSYPAITNSVSFAAGTLTVKWQTIPGVVYHVLTNASLALPGAWVEDTAVSPVTGDGAVDSISIPGLPGPVPDNFFIIKQTEY